MTNVPLKVKEEPKTTRHSNTNNLIKPLKRQADLYVEEEQKDVAKLQIDLYSNEKEKKGNKG